MKKIVDKFVDGCVGIVNKILPDAFIFAALLTFVVFIFAIIVAFNFAKPAANLLDVPGGTPGGTGFFNTILSAIYKGWYGGFWSLLAFTMQMALIIVTGDIFANTPQMKKVMRALARLPKTPGQAVAFEAFFSIFVSFFQWGAALIMAGLLAKEIARNLSGVHFALLVAAGYLGLGMWHGGFSGSIPLKLPDGSYIAQTGVAGMKIPFKYTLFAWFNLFNYIGGMILLPLAFLGLHPKGEKVVTCDPALLVEEDDTEKVLPKEEMHINDKLNRAPWIAYGLCFFAAVSIVLYFVIMIVKQQLFSLSIDFVNFLFLFLALGLYGRPNRLVTAVTRSASGAAGVMLQFPFYGGISGLMTYDGGTASNNSLAEIVSNFFKDISTPKTYPLLTFLSAGIINFFIPSGGGQWAVQGPIVMPAAHEIAVEKLGATFEMNEFNTAVIDGSDEYQAYLGKSAMALAWGDSWTNLIQPFWALPLLAIANLEAKDIMGYCVLGLLILGVWVIIGFLIL